MLYSCEVARRFVSVNLPVRFHSPLTPPTPEREREREIENFIFYKDCSLGLTVKNMSNK